MVAPAFVVLEQRSWWAPLLRRMAPYASVLEARTWEACGDFLVEQPLHFIVLELREPSFGSTVRQLHELRRRGGSHAAAVVCRPELRPLRWLVREAGAVAVASSALQLRRFQDIAQRHWVTSAASHDADSQLDASIFPAMAHIHSRMPWPFVAQRQRHFS